MEVFLFLPPFPKNRYVLSILKLEKVITTISSDWPTVLDLLVFLKLVLLVICDGRDVLVGFLLREKGESCYLLMLLN